MVSMKQRKQKKGLKTLRKQGLDRQMANEMYPLELEFDEKSLIIYFLHLLNFHASHCP